MDLRWGGGSLLGGDVLELDRRFIVWASTCRTQSVHRRLDVVEAELAYLYMGALAMADSEPLHRVFEGSVPGSRKDTGGNSCPTGRTPRRIAGSIHPRRRRQTGLAVCGTWRWCEGVLSSGDGVALGVKKEFGAMGAGKIRCKGREIKVKQLQERDQRQP